MKENILSLLGSDMLVTEKFTGTIRRSEYLEPEKALLLAVLEDAVDSFVKYHSAHDRIGKGRFHEAEEWIMQTGDDWIFSFDNICESLSLDPQYLRRGLRQWRARLAKQKKLTPYHGLRRNAA
jgi:hypothetical protein